MSEYYKLMFPFYYMNLKPDIQLIGYEEYKSIIHKDRTEDEHDEYETGE